MQMRALITGISGFVGSHLARYLLTLGADVCGIARRPESEWSFPGSERLEVCTGNILDEDFLRNCIETIRPTHVFHLAGTLGGAVGSSLGQYESNAWGTVRLLDALRALRPAPWVLVAGSSAVYGPAGNLPIGEEQAFQPLTHYAASKAAQELVAIQHHLAYGMNIVRTRTFNLVGPGLSRALAPSELAYQVAHAEAGGPSVIQVGNLAPRRDYSDVRDVVRAYVALAAASRPGEVFNVCSGHSRSVQECAEILTGMARAPVRLEVNSARMRRVEIEDQVGNGERLVNRTGWQPLIPIEKSLGDLLDCWRHKLNVAGEACPGRM
jgi:GDP-4-dehydro-6-deoxy-D-mannose reductase